MSFIVLSAPFMQYPVGGFIEVEPQSILRYLAHQSLTPCHRVPGTDLHIVTSRVVVGADL